MALRLYRWRLDENGWTAAGLYSARSASTGSTLVARRAGKNVATSALEARPDFRPYLAEDWWFRPLFDDPIFQALVTGGDDPSSR